METRFSNLQSGDTGNVVGFTEGSTSHRSKLLAMGLVRDVPFHVVRKAPLGDPVEIRVNGFHFYQRRKETEMLRLKGYLQTLDTSFPCGGWSDINSTRPKYFRWKNWLFPLWTNFERDSILIPVGHISFKQNYLGKYWSFTVIFLSHFIINNP